jgi:hypothetical protein
MAAQQPLVECCRPAEQINQVWISAIGAILLSHAEAEIWNILAERRVDQERPEAVRGNEVIRVFERTDRQTDVPKPALKGCTDIVKEIRERAYHGYAV